MSPREVAGRSRDAALHRRWRRRQVIDERSDTMTLPAASPSFAATLPLSSAVVPQLPRARVLAAADELLEGRWPVFALSRTDMSPSPDWFLDPKTGRRAPADAYCFRIDHRHEAEVGNVKYLWETSRHQHCSVLAAAWWVSGREEYAEAAATQLRSWWTANPFLSGVHWTSGIELGVRLLSWVWVRRLLDGWSGVQDLFDGNPAFLRQLHHHQEYLATLPSRGSSANNHLIAEMAGLFASSCAFPWFPESQKWRRRAGDTLARELPRQTFPDGLNRELATAYHAFVLELGLAAALEGERSGHPLKEQVWQTLCSMTDAAAAVVDIRLRPPRQGDDDNGHGLLLDPPTYDRWASLLATGEQLFGRLPWWPDVPRDDVRTILLTGLATAPAVPSGRPIIRPSVFPDAGVVVLRTGGGGGHEIWCRGDVGPHGYLPIAAHAHADALSVEVRVDGVDVLADPGTYCYHGEPAWRSWSRSTRAHNTLEVAGRDQSVSGGPFLWTRHARARLERVSGFDDGRFAEWQAVHDGYRRLSPPARHRRRVRLDRVAGQLEIDDFLECEGKQDVRLSFHLGPTVECRLGADHAELRWIGPDHTPVAATLSLPAQLDWESVCGRTEPPAGWYSPAFGVLVPTVTLVGVGRLGTGGPLRTTFAVHVPSARPSSTALRMTSPSPTDDSREFTR
ncbi:MAG: alginate lyase family protein [Sporichthyaceae bacterium]